MQRTQGLKQSRDETHKLETKPLWGRSTTLPRPRHPDLDILSRGNWRSSSTQSLYNYCVFITACYVCNYLHRCVSDLRFAWCSLRRVVDEFALRLSETSRTGSPMSEDPVRLHFFCTLLSSHCEYHHTLCDSTPPASAAHPAARSLAQWCQQVDASVSWWMKKYQTSDLHVSQHSGKAFVILVAQYVIHNECHSEQA